MSRLQRWRRSMLHSAVRSRVGGRPRTAAGSGLRRRSKWSEPSLVPSRLLRAGGSRCLPQPRQSPRPPYPTIDVRIPDWDPVGLEEGGNWIGARIENGWFVGYRFCADGNHVSVWCKYWNGSTEIRSRSSRRGLVRGRPSRGDKPERGGSQVDGRAEACLRATAR